MSLHIGKIKRGTGRAGKLGFPSINIPLKAADVSGIYVARVVIDGISHNAAAYADQRRKLLEAHIVDFSGELYGHEASIELLEKIRDRKVFGNDKDLIAAIAEDVQKVRKYFEK